MDSDKQWIIRPLRDLGKRRKAENASIMCYLGSNKIDGFRGRPWRRSNVAKCKLSPRRPDQRSGAVLAQKRLELLQRHHLPGRNWKKVLYWDKLGHCWCSCNRRIIRVKEYRFQSDWKSLPTFFEIIKQIIMSIGDMLLETFIRPRDL